MFLRTFFVAFLSFSVCGCGVTVAGVSSSIPTRPASRTASSYSLSANTAGGKKTATSCDSREETKHTVEERKHLWWISHHQREQLSQNEKLRSHRLVASALPSFRSFLRAAALKDDNHKVMPLCTIGNRGHLSIHGAPVEARNSLPWKRTVAVRIRRPLLLARLLLLHLLGSSALVLGLAANSCLSRRGLHLRLPRSIAALVAKHARIHAIILARLSPSTPWLHQLLLAPLLEELEFRVLLPLLILLVLRSSRAAGSSVCRWAAGSFKTGAEAQAEDKAPEQDRYKVTNVHETRRTDTDKQQNTSTSFSCIHSTGIVGVCSALFGLAHYQAVPLSFTATRPFSTSTWAAACVGANRCLTATLQGLVWGLGPTFVLKPPAYAEASVLLPVLSLLLHIFNNAQALALLWALWWLGRDKRRNKLLVTLPRSH